jgi:hypothetical protein
MSSILTCLFRNCIEHSRNTTNSSRNRAAAYEEEEDNDVMGPARSRRNLLLPSSRRRASTERMQSVLSTSDPPRRTLLIRDMEGGDSEDEDEAEEEVCHLSGEPSQQQQQQVEEQRLILGGLFSFLRRLSTGAQAAFSPSFETSPEHPFSILGGFNNSVTSTPIKKLREAKTFILSGERGKDSYPSISFDEIVLPGSEVQRAMAKQMQVEMDLMMEEPYSLEECVICMDSFTPDNPRMPTLCGCGENKTYFHLPCLYQWIDQGGRNCPSCRQKLVWEEF